MNSGLQLALALGLVLTFIGSGVSLLKDWGDWQDPKKRTRILYVKVTVGALFATLSLWAIFGFLASNGGKVVALGAQATAAPVAAAAAPSPIATASLNVYPTAAPIATDKPTPMPTVFPASLAESGPLKKTSLRLASDIVGDCNSPQLVDESDVRRRYHHALSVIVGRLNAAGLSSLEVSDAWLQGQLSCNDMQGIATSIDILAQKL